MAATARFDMAVRMRKVLAIPRDLSCDHSFQMVDYTRAQWLPK